MSNSTYRGLQAEADAATTEADENPTEANHRKAASLHLAAAVHAKAIGWGEAASAHDQKADEHIAAMKSCAGGGAVEAQ